jgi:hypothetical protein
MTLNKELVWPCMMFIASAISVGGSLTAIIRGDGNDTAAFKTNATTSCIYMIGHGVRIYQVCMAGHAAAELARREAVELTEITIQR